MNLRNFFGGFVEIANGLASILTLGHFAPGWDVRYYCWVTILKIERLKKRQSKENGNNRRG